MKSLYKMSIYELMDMLNLNIDILYEKTNQVTQENSNTLIEYLKNKGNSADKILVDLDLISERLWEEIHVEGK